MIIFAKNWQKSPKFAIITSTPDPVSQATSPADFIALSFKDSKLAVKVIAFNSIEKQVDLVVSISKGLPRQLH
jgi:hypothetical protein